MKGLEKRYLNNIFIEQLYYFVSLIEMDKEAIVIGIVGLLEKVKEKRQDMYNNITKNKVLQLEVKEEYFNKNI